MFTNYLTEIISKKDWENPEHPYRKEFQKSFSKTQYPKIEPKLKALFTELNNGTFSDTVIMDLKTKGVSKLNTYDKKLIPILVDLGYTVSKESYLAGMASKDNKEIKILDILKGFDSKIKTKDKMAEIFDKTENAAIGKQLEAIEKLDDSNLISGTRIDVNKLSIYSLNKENIHKLVWTMDHRAIASQSTEVGWTSCMDLGTNNRGSIGVYAHKVGSGTSAGVFIVYLTKAGDEMELENPTARILLKPYIADDGIAMLWRADKVYGTAPKEFKTQVLNVLSRLDSTKRSISEPMKTYQLSQKVYADTSPQKVTVGRLTQDGFNKLSIDSQVQFIKQKHKDALQYLQSVSDKIKIKLIEANDNIFQYIKNPSEAVQLAAAGEAHSSALRYIKNPSEAVQRLALSNSGYTIKYIQNPSEAMQLIAVKQFGGAIQYIKNPSEAVQLAAVKEDSDAIQYIKDPSEAVQLAAVSTNCYASYAIQYIKNPSEAVQLRAVKKRGVVIKYIKNPSEAVKFAAVRKEGGAIKYIKNPSEILKRIALSKDKYAFLKTNT